MDVAAALFLPTHRTTVDTASSCHRILRNPVTAFGGIPPGGDYQRWLAELDKTTEFDTCPKGISAAGFFHPRALDSVRSSQTS